MTEYAMLLDINMELIKMNVTLEAILKELRAGK